MILTRRSLLGGMAALFAAPAIVRAASLMPVQKPALILPEKPRLIVPQFAAGDEIWFDETGTIPAMKRKGVIQYIAADDQPLITDWNGIMLRGGIMPTDEARI